MSSFQAVHVQRFVQAAARFTEITSFSSAAFVQARGGLLTMGSQTCRDSSSGGLRRGGRVERLHSPFKSKMSVVSSAEHRRSGRHSLIHASMSSGIRSFKRLCVVQAVWSSPPFKQDVLVETTDCRGRVQRGHKATPSSKRLSDLQPIHVPSSREGTAPHFRSS